MIRRTLLAAVLAAAFLPGCQTVETTQAGAVGVDRQQRMMLSSEQVNEAAAKAYHELLAEAKVKGVLDRDPGQVQRVAAITRRLIPATAAFRADAPKWEWEAHVISTQDVNAFCMPGGKMAVFAGLIEKLQVTDDELAAVMGHEVAHALREHGRERASQAMAQGMALSILGAVAGVSDPALNLGQLLLDVALNLPNSRGHEVEADRIGVELAARSGYDPRAAITLWEKMGKVGGGGQPPKWLSTHPSHEDRIRDLREYAARVLPLYEQAKQTAKR